MSWKIRLSPEALAQLDDLYDYVALVASPAIALRFNGAVLDRLETLQAFPNIGTLREDILDG